LLPGTEPLRLSQEEFEELLASRVRDAFGMSVEEFQAALNDGSLDAESFEVSDLALAVSARTG
jgi:hypothetical protein